MAELEEREAALENSLGTMENSFQDLNARDRQLQAMLEEHVTAADDSDAPAAGGGAAGATPPPPPAPPAAAADAK